MKADILRRAEAILEQEDEDGFSSDQSNERVVFSPEDELEEPEALKIKDIGDGEENDENDSKEDEEENRLMPEAILELAWLRDAKLFDRGAVIRRSEGRIQLRKDTGEFSTLR